MAARLPLGQAKERMMFPTLTRASVFRLIAMVSLIVLLAFAAGSRTHESAAVETEIKVAVVDRAGGGMGGGAATVAQLNDDTFFDFSATLVAPADVDTAAELAAYDAVVLGGSGYGNDPIWSVAMADAVADFVEGGGGLVMTGWGLWNSYSGGIFNTAAASILDDVVAGQLGVSYSHSYSPPELTITDSSHPITDGLPTTIAYASPYGCCLETNIHALPAGDVSLGTTNAGAGNSLIYREDIGPGNGRSVYLGALHLAATAGYPAVQDALRSGAGDQLLEQTLAWIVDGATNTKADILMGSGVPGKGLENAPGLQKGFNPKSAAAENAGMKK